MCVWRQLDAYIWSMNLEYSSWTQLLIIQLLLLLKFSNKRQQNIVGN